MKKTIALILILILSIPLFACHSEYVMTQNDLTVDVDALPEDNHRVYYEIFVGAFSDSNEDGIGDLNGIAGRLDYLNDGDPNSGESLGVEGIWLMPVMPSPSYHKYDVMDYKSIDPRYGTMDDFDHFVEQANTRGIDVIIDLVLNHTSSQHPWFEQAKAAIEDGDYDNPYIDYYVIVPDGQRENDKTYHHLHDDLYYEGNFSPDMPELNLDNDDVRDEIKDILAFWYDAGVHGFRLDATKYAYLNDQAKNIEFWGWFIDECKSIKPDTFVVGETWSSDNAIAPYYENFTNFDFGMAQSTGYVSIVANQRDTVNWLVSYMDRYRNLVENYDSDAVLAPFISNHDMNRAAGYLSVPDYEMHSAASLYILSYGSPFIYYGEEIGMKGVRSTEPTDANRRLAMLWGDGDSVEDPVGSTFDPDEQTNGTVRDQIGDPDSLYNHYKKLIMLRKANPEIARGEYEPLHFDGYFSFGGFLSTYETSTIGVFHNVGEETITVDLSEYTDNAFDIVRGYAGKGDASLDGQVLTIDSHTSIVLK